MKFAVVMRVLFFFVLCVSAVSACLWDRDTLAEEAKGRLATVRIIAGWFNQHPPRYYEMRLERVAREIESEPDNLGLYDDTAVACDRLGRYDEAIAWMERKKVVLDALPADEAAEHRYRYLANLGTFIVHRWVSQPEADRNADLAPLREGEKLIAQAIEENPQAHFGREVYQLKAIRWMLSGERLSEESDPYTFEDGWVSVDRFSPSNSNVDEDISGITGLIQLGAAWNSLDAFHTLTAVLESGEYASLAEMSYLRELELVDQGAGSIHPVQSVRDRVIPKQSSYLQNRNPVAAYFPEVRQAARERNEAWIKYQTERFAKGKHPDTHPDFWDSWVEPSFPELPGPTLRNRSLEMFGNHPLIFLMIFITGALLIVAIIFKVFSRLNAGRKFA